jgi:hypothetical protein
VQPKARRAYVPGLAALFVVAVAGCSADSGADGSATDAKPGGPTSATAAQPGKYRTLSEACGSVPRATLKDLLPGSVSLPEDQREKVYQGTAAATYDTDRRVGCSWKADSPEASNQLVIDVERVVSYDPAVSDDARAQEVYAKKETGADLPAPTPSSSSGTSGTSGPSETVPGSGTPGAPASGAASGAASDTASGTAVAPDTKPQEAAARTASAEASDDASAAPESATPTASPTATPAADGLEPRVLDDLGDAAFLDDILARSGSAAQRRTVSVVFRTSNVIVTVRYTEQFALDTDPPDSRELQDKTRGLARTLAEQLDE